ncbi:MAG: poly-gamma-glutamate hydrolase family protein [Deltaproteobacteria bacterium]|nr:poly-gamma-glutamate hydrolase family protein [Deltaproteobacteria bacterium]
MDRYRSFAELEKYEKANEDYRIVVRRRPSHIAIMAPHGGGIEFGTAAIAASIARPNHTFWAFKGIKQTGNRVLHITSTRFDEPSALMVAANAQTVVTIHGCSETAVAIYVGGRHRELGLRIHQSLCRAGFNTQIGGRPALLGENPSNLCNQCSGGKGIQLEISAALRKRMFAWSEENGIKRKGKSFHRFTHAVRTALAR